jgi:hypothetical protein
MPIQQCFLDPSKESELWPKCQSVLNHEHFRYKLPQKSLACIFDNEERSYFTNPQRLGKNFCGFTTQVCEPKFSTDMPNWPPEILRCVSDGSKYFCDVTVYLRNRTCQSQTGTVITFAHELQHFTQYGNSRKAWLANRHLQRIYRLCQQRVPPWHFPYEYEALLVSKQVAEEVLSPGEVRDYTEQECEHEQIERVEDLKKWEFFLRLDVREEYDLLEKTKIEVRKCRDYLEEYCQTDNSDAPDYSKDEWWK